MLSLLRSLSIWFSLVLYALSWSSHAQTLSIYCEEDRPLQFYDSEGKLTGMTVEIVQEIQKRTGNTDPIQVVPWARGLDKIDHNPNTLLFSMARTPERENSYQWIGPIMANIYGLYAKADSTLQVHNIEQAKNISLIGVYRDDIRDQTLTRLGFTNLDRASSNISSFKKLMMGRIAVYTDSQLGVESLAVASGFKPSDVKLIFELFKSELYIAASKATSPALVEKWNHALEDMKRDKTFARIQQKYLHTERNPKLHK
ncbi:substrate-binding periplasmic protein [Undibacterium flavidum]|uniref:Transporter substrate-binding domain-containing protein n=1 Tax=Undibacterium flavidum TaxID=2762297 RepID=A0ABR6Y7J0_9BURK|nr:transporter substrate-binding domain-containing protein [Undibacterium flavidum]MBC3872567.1 transporter substrate-binding domain-containing protein [Undibacterium flavidum]